MSTVSRPARRGQRPMVLFLGLISSHWLTRRRAFWGPGYGLPSHRARAASGGDAARFSEELADATKLVRAEKLKECADEFDAIHDVKRPMRVGSVDEIISAAELRPYIIKSLERRLTALTPAVLAEDRVADRPQS